ncbi:MAG TPA: phage tail protein [Candidatus Angelobacter sp.]|nr:phage tail protein [Candidatus Angelobacter sp.]
MATVYTLPVSFYFEVKFAGIKNADDSCFAEADGLEMELGTVEIKEGGENRFSHRLPDRATHRNLTLKRGVLPANSELAQWCKSTLESDFGQRLKTRNIDVSLLDKKGNPLLVWSFTAAWPVKWNVAGLDATKNELALETLEFCYSRSVRQRQPDGQ